MQKNIPNYTPNTHFGVLGCPGGGLGGSKSSEGLRRGFFAPNRKVQKPNIVCIYPKTTPRWLKLKILKLVFYRPTLTEDIIYFLRLKNEIILTFGCFL